MRTPRAVVNVYNDEVHYKNKIKEVKKFPLV